MAAGASGSAVLANAMFTNPHILTEKLLEWEQQRRTTGKAARGQLMEKVQSWA